MNRSELVESVVALNYDLLPEMNRVEKRKLFAAIVTSTFDVIKDQLAKGEHVTIQDFGRFDAPIRKAHTVNSPFTNGEKFVPEYRSPRFRAATKLKEAVRQS